MYGKLWHILQSGIASTVFLGPSSGGKTCLLLRFMYGKFIENPNATLSPWLVEIEKRNILEVGGQSLLQEELWPEIIKAIIKANPLTFFVIDITDDNHFKVYRETIEKYPEIKRKHRFFLIANKIDILKLETYEYPSHLKNLDHDIIMTSAKNGAGCLTVAEIIDQQGGETTIDLQKIQEVEVSKEEIGEKIELDEELLDK
ncbi:MAG: GTPase domain-containing protein [Candidatus Hodarchaeota archaeon]